YLHHTRSNLQSSDVQNGAAESHSSLAQDTYALKKASVWRNLPMKTLQKNKYTKISRLDTLASAWAFGVTGIVFEFLWWRYVYYKAVHEY
ncbi:hypothetical protein CEXT_147961, partial [Caerostris extrusa]